VTNSRISKSDFPAIRAALSTASGLPLRGVGNEAILCASDTDKSNGELVVGRVRDNIFTVAIYAGTANDPAMTKDALADKAEEIAKQVAGILF
jgi:hypothetical protein